MNIVLWILAGGIVGWVGYSALHVNEQRGLVVSAIIGAAGAIFGGYMLAPMFHATTGNPGDFSSFALMMAFASAVGCAAFSDMMYERFGF